MGYIQSPLQKCPNFNLKSISYYLKYMLLYLIDVVPIWTPLFDLVQIH